MNHLRPSALICGLLVLALAAAPATQPVNKPAIVTTQQWESKPQPIPDSRRHVPRFVTIHHAGVEWKTGGDPVAFIRNMQAWGQREKGWPDLPYHFLIAPDGRIFEGRRIEYEPESNTRYLLQGNLGVEMMGNFEMQRPSPKQIESCVKLTAWLVQEHGIAMENVRGHKDAARGQTACPGRDFQRYLDTKQFHEWVTAALRGENPQIIPGPPLDSGPTTQIAE